MSEPIDRARLVEATTRRLGTRYLVPEIVVLSETDSTMDECRRRFPDQVEGSNASIFRFVFAERQSAGRGRPGKRWSAEPATSLLFSFRPFEGERRGDSVHSRNDEALISAVAVAVARVVDSFTRRDVRIQWPNDILIDRRKVAGILIERRPFTVVGVGINVNQSTEQLPTATDKPATSLRLAQDVLNARLDERPDPCFDLNEVAAVTIESLLTAFRQIDEVIAGADRTSTDQDQIERDWRRYFERQPQDLIEVTMIGLERSVIRGRLIDFSPRDGLRLQIVPADPNRRPDELDRNENWSVGRSEPANQIIGDVASIPSARIAKLTLIGD
jgi:biotin-[acetyl-CoA-carboxylase] ligase BirA-like protein